jgi:hypothetical protein
MDTFASHLAHPTKTKAFNYPIRRARGVASVEAVVALPFFVLLFVSLFYLRDELLKKQQLDMKARTCAWLYSANNCEHIPSGCDDVIASPGTTATQASGDLHTTLEGGARKASGLSKVVSDIVNGLLGNVMDAAFGRSFDATARGTVDRPSLFGGGSSNLSSHFHLACNLAEQTPVDVVTNAWKIFEP